MTDIEYKNIARKLEKLYDLYNKVGVNSVTVRDFVSDSTHAYTKRNVEEWIKSAQDRSDDFKWAIVMRRANLLYEELRK